MGVPVSTYIGHENGTRNYTAKRAAQYAGRFKVSQEWLLEQIAAEYGRPKRIRVDQGPEFISKDLDLWAYQHDVVLDFSRPGKPTDIAFAESFNGRVRAECLNANWFLNSADTRLKCEAWRRDYNEVRPHSSLGN